MERTGNWQTVMTVRHTCWTPTERLQHWASHHSAPSLPCSMPTSSSSSARCFTKSLFSPSPRWEIIFRIFMVYLDANKYSLPSFHVSYSRNNFQTFSHPKSDFNWGRTDCLQGPGTTTFLSQSGPDKMLQSSVGWLPFQDEPAKDQLTPCKCGSNANLPGPGTRRIWLAGFGPEAWLESVLELPQSELWGASSVIPREKKRKAGPTSLSLEIVWAHAHQLSRQCPNHWGGGRWAKLSKETHWYQNQG